MRYPLLRHLTAGLALATLVGCATQEDLRRGEIEQAVRAARFDQVVTLAERGMPDPAKATNEQLFPLCLAHAQMKRYDKLLPCLDRLDANFAQGDRTLVKATGYTRTSADLLRYLLRAEALLELGRYDAAISVAESATRRDTGFLDSGIASVTAIRVLPIVGVARALKGEREAARNLARELEDTVVIPLPELIEIKHTGIARLYAATADFGKALEHIEKSDQTTLTIVLAVLATASGQSGLSHSVLPPNFPYVMLPRLYLRMKCLLETGRYEEAKRGFDALLARPQIRSNAEIYWMTLYDRGRIAEQEGSSAEAMRYYRRAIEVIEQYRSSINTEANKIGFVGNKHSVYARLIDLLVAAGAVELAFEYVERAKSRALVDMLAGQQDFASKTAVVPALRSLLDAAGAAESAAREQSPEGRKRGVPAGSQSALAALSEETASLVSVRALTAAQVRGHVDADETLVEYYQAESRLLAFVMNRERVIVLELDGRGLSEEVGELRRAIMLVPTLRYRASAARLFQRLIAPLLPHLRSANLAIVPHGVLHYVPFNALLQGERFLIEGFGLRTLPSASVLKFIAPQAPAKAGSMLSIGSPDLGDPKLALPGARREAQAIGELFPRAMVLVEGGATETAFRQHAASFRYLHVASHGEFFPATPLQSRLRLARDAGNDGHLSVAELYAIRLDVDMVTLSACETGVGELANGDEYVGLTRGFLYAGARSVVASMWKVDDVSTLELMQAFYAGLAQAGRREALRQAQIAQLGLRRHPFYWAAFQLTGSAR